MLVHISVDKELRHDKKAMAELMELIVETGGVREHDEGRFHRFAVLSGHIDPEKIEEIRRLGGVIAVEPDEKRYPL